MQQAPRVHPLHPLRSDPHVAPRPQFGLGRQQTASSQRQEKVSLVYLLRMGASCRHRLSQTSEIIGVHGTHRNPGQREDPSLIKFDHCVLNLFCMRASGRHWFSLPNCPLILKGESVGRTLERGRPLGGVVKLTASEAKGPFAPSLSRRPSDALGSGAAHDDDDDAAPPVPNSGAGNWNAVPRAWLSSLM